MSGKLVAVDNSTAPANINQFDIVDIEHAAAAQKNFNDLVEALLDKSDYQMIRTKDGIQPKKKKSAWRKLARAFNISDDIIEEEIIRDECHRIISAKFVVKATLPNGRYGMGVGDCSIYDKVKKDDEKEPTPFELRKRFNNAEHDVLTTAHTRAKSRAISDLVGGGEVSAEELSGGDNVKPIKPSAPKPSNPKPSAPKPKMNKPKPPVKPKVEDTAIEVEATEVTGDKPKSFKEICDSNPSLTIAVKELQANETAVNTNSVRDKLLDLWDVGKINDEEYKTAKALLE